MQLVATLMGTYTYSYNYAKQPPRRWVWCVILVCGFFFLSPKKGLGFRVKGMFWEQLSHDDGSLAVLL